MKTATWKVWGILAFGTVVTGVHAQEIHNWRSASGEVWKDAAGECWRDASWTPATAAAGCDGAIAATPKPSVPVAAPAAPLQVQPAVAPKLAAAPAKTTFKADTLFDFDKAVIKSKGKTELNELVDKIHGMSYEVVIVIGHTDSIGTDAYNLKLSMRRAEAVKAYLVSKGIPSKQIRTEGKGKSQPVASNKTAAGRAENRRVDVEIVGASK